MSNFHQIRTFEKEVFPNSCYRDKKRHVSVGFSSDGRFSTVMGPTPPKPDKNDSQTGMSRLSLELQRLFVKARVWRGKSLNIETPKALVEHSRSLWWRLRPGPCDIRKRTRSDVYPFSPHVLLICAFSMTELNACFNLFYELIPHGRLGRED